MQEKGGWVFSRQGAVCDPLLDAGLSKRNVSTHGDKAPATKRKQRSDGAGGGLRHQAMPQLTRRDLAVLTWIGEQYGVRFDSLQKLLGRMAGKAPHPPAEAGKISARNVRRIIKRWQTLGALQYRKLLYGEPGWVWLTSKGLRDMGLKHRYYTPAPAALHHFHHTNELRIWLENRYGARMHWTGERQLRAAWNTLAADERQQRHVADGELTLDGTPIALEVELTPKSNRRVETIVQRLALHYGAVWYFVNDATEPVIRRAIGPHETKIRVYNLIQIFP